MNNNWQKKYINCLLQMKLLVLLCSRNRKWNNSLFPSHFFPARLISWWETDRWAAVPPVVPFSVPSLRVAAAVLQQITSHSTTNHFLFCLLLFFSSAFPAFYIQEAGGNLVLIPGLVDCDCIFPSSGVCSSQDVWKVICIRTIASLIPVVTEGWRIMIVRFIRKHFIFSVFFITFSCLFLFFSIIYSCGWRNIIRKVIVN